MMVELNVDLLGLAMIYLQKSRRELTAINILETCQRILQWAENKGSGKPGKLQVRDGHIWVDEQYLCSEDGEIWSAQHHHAIIGVKDRSRISHGYQS